MSVARNTHLLVGEDGLLEELDGDGDLAREMRLEQLGRRAPRRRPHVLPPARRQHRGPLVDWQRVELKRVDSGGGRALGRRRLGAGLAGGGALVQQQHGRVVEDAAQRVPAMESRGRSGGGRWRGRGRPWKAMEGVMSSMYMKEKTVLLACRSMASLYRRRCVSERRSVSTTSWRGGSVRNRMSAAAR